MKKIISLILVLTTLLICLISCSSDISSDNKFINLNDNEILRVGESYIFKNYETENKDIVSLEYLKDAVYTLRRSYSSYSTPTNIAYYNGYYYYWDISYTHDEKTLGEKTVKTVYNYSYLTYTENENLVVKTIVKNSTSFDYEGGFISKDFTYTLNLNGYFLSYEDMHLKCPELAEQIDITGTRKYYIDVTVPDTITTSTKEYNNYYYIENN